MRAPLDTHNHLKGWSDGRQTLSELMSLAREKGVRVGVSDHAGRTDHLSTRERLLEYADFLSSHPVARGIEMDLDRPLTLDEDVRARFDYVIGSVHGVTVSGRRVSFSKTFGSIQGKTGYDPREEVPRMEDLLHAHLELLDTEFSRQRYDILGHGTVLPPLVLGPPEEVFPSWWEDGLIALLGRHGVAVEISNRWKTPYERLLGKCLHAGLRFSLGSDGHDGKRSCRLDYPLAMKEQHRIPQDRFIDVERIP